jgi:hypothetical protein
MKQENANVTAFSTDNLCHDSGTSAFSLSFHMVYYGDFPEQARAYPNGVAKLSYLAKQKTATSLT